MKKILIGLCILSGVSALADDEMIIANGDGTPFVKLENAFNKAKRAKLNEAYPSCVNGAGVFVDSGLRPVQSAPMIDKNKYSVKTETQSVMINRSTFVCRMDKKSILKYQPPGAGRLFPTDWKLSKETSLWVINNTGIGKTPNEETLYDFILGLRGLSGWGCEYKIFKKPDLVFEMKCPAKKYLSTPCGEETPSIQKITIRELNSEYIQKTEVICPSDPTRSKTEEYMYWGRW